jgi:RimJ/RimL family protein N-acetyltransferase
VNPLFGAPLQGDADRRAVIETARLRLRRIVPADAAFILRLLNEPSFLRNIGDRQVRTLADAQAFIASGPQASYAKHGFGLYLVELRESAAPAGICGLLKRDVFDAADLGYALAPEFWSKGYASEAAAAVLAFARETLGLTRVLAITKGDNAASIRLLDKLGFRFERMVRMAPDQPEIELRARAL